MAERICTENLHLRIEAPSGDAVIKQLADTINTLIERLERDMRKQSIFISDASHEMRTPVAVIKGYADLMNRWGKNDPHILQEAIDTIQLETAHMNTLINSLLALARDGDERPLETKAVSLNAAAVEAIREAVLLHPDSNIELVAHSEEIVLGNYGMILQMLRVFLNNSLKYTVDIGEPIQIILSGDENGSYLTVKDNGIGICADDLPFIFERFYRADKSRSNKIPGFGLGLAVADMAARAHHATIGVYSELGVGTEFTVSFPPYNGLR